MNPRHNPPATARFFWPIHDQAVGWDALIAQACADLPLLAAQAHVRLVAPGAFRIARSVDVPGSGRITPTVLIYEAPARPLKARNYRRAPRGVAA